MDTTLSRFSNPTINVRCEKCRKLINQTSDACQAMGNIYHIDCFKCTICRQSLCDQRFYFVRRKVFCENDYSSIGFHKKIDVCYACDEAIHDNMVEALDHVYHSYCFRCSSCQQCLDGQPFTVDKDQRILCLFDYHKMYAPRCEKCSQPIQPEEVGSNETIRVVAMKKNYHVDCYRCEDCQTSLIDENSSTRSGACCPLADGTLLCYRCRIGRNQSIESMNY